MSKKQKLGLFCKVELRTWPTNFLKDPSDLVEPFSVEDDGNDGYNWERAREPLSVLWESAFHKFVIGDSMHELLGKKEDVWITGPTNQQSAESPVWSDK